jgi:phytol kinase
LPGDILALIASYLYVAIVLGGAELIRRRAGLGVDFTRKVVHVGVGLWVVPTLLLFESWALALVPPASFVVLNALSYRFSVARSIETGEKNLGTILFPFAFIVLIAWFWPRGRPDAIAGGILVLALGDAAAALVGKRWGRHPYRIGKATRSAEGSAAMFVASFIALFAATRLFGAPVSPVVLAGLAAFSTVLEGVSQLGFDNLLVPVGTAVALSRIAPAPM